MSLKRSVNAYPYPQDPDDKLDYGFEFSLNADEIISNAIVQVVDAITDQPAVGTDLIISDVSFGPTEKALVSGVTYWVTGGARNQSYYIRCEIITSTGRSITRTMRLLCADQ